MSIHQIAPTAQYPKAGEHHKTAWSRVLSLAPLPLPTGFPPIAQQLNLKDATETTLDHGKSDYWSFEFGIRAQICWVMCIFFVTLLIHFTAAFLALSEGDTDSFLYAFFVIPMPAIAQVYLFSVGGCIAMLTCFTVIGYFKKAKQIPIRFNRQRREVFAVIGSEHFIAPWESISVQVESALMYNRFTATTLASLTFQIPNLKIGQQATFTMNYPVEALAIAEWEAIRLFIEEGLSILKQQNQIAENEDPDELQQLKANPQQTSEYYDKLLDFSIYGTVEYFYLTKNKMKYGHSKASYIFWTIGHILTGWTFPCHIAAWLTRKNYVRRPSDLLKWSEPISQELCSKPNDQLLIQSKILLECYQNPKTPNIKEYFMK